MQFGVCGGPSIAAVAKQAGMSYFEWSVQAFLQPRAERAAFEQALAQVRAAPLPCPVCNCFLPGDLKVTGPVVDDAAVDAYVATAFARAEEAGVDTIVFGSGGARAVPQGFDPAQAQAQLVAFLKRIAPVAARHRVTVVIEPLRRQECNIYNTVDECAAATRKVNHPAIRLLVDGYHWAQNEEPAASILEAGPLFGHMHIATKASRRTPGAEPCEAIPAFLKAVRACGYTGRLSIEGRIDKPELELAPALELMRR